MTDERLRAMIRHHDFLREREAKSRRALSAAILEWSTERRFCVPPRIENVRRELAA